jgi:hypothetical protein
MLNCGHLSERKCVFHISDWKWARIVLAKLAIRIPNLKSSLGVLPGSLAQFERLKLRQKQRSTTAKELLLHLAG